MASKRSAKAHSAETLALGGFLRERRLARGWTLEVLAARTGCEVSTISNIERGVTKLQRAGRGKGWAPTPQAMAKALELDTADQERFEQLLEACRKSASSGQASIGRVPGNAFDTQVSGAHAPARFPELELPGPIPPLSPISSSDGRDLLGRSGEITSGLDSLRETPILLLRGPAGQGKTDLAAAIANSSRDQFPQGGWRLDLERLPDLKIAGAAIARHLGGVDMPFDELPMRLQMTQCIVVLDSFEQIWLRTSDQDRRDFLDTLDRCADRSGNRFIITSQIRFQHRGVKGFRVGPLDPGAASELFHRSAESRYLADEGPELSEFLQKHLGGNPQSIIMVATHGLVTHISLARLREQWETQWDRIASASLAEHIGLNTKSLLASFEMSYNALSDADKAVFLSVSWLPDGVVAAQLGDMWGERDDEARASLARLERRSFLESADDGWTWLGPSFRFAEYKRKYEVEHHPDSELAAALQQYEQQINAFYAAFIRTYAPQQGDPDYQGKTERIYRHFGNLYATLDRLLTRAANPAEVLAAVEVLDALRWLYHNNLSGFAETTSPSHDIVRFYRRAVDILEATGESSAAMGYQHAIAEILWLRQDYNQVPVELQPVLDSALALEPLKNKVGRIDAHVTYTKESLRRAIAKYADLADRARKLGDDEERIKNTLGLIDCFRKVEDYESALQVYDELAVELDSMKPNDRGNVLRGYAYVLLKCGKLGEAESAYEDAMAAFRESGHHPFGQAHCQRGLGDVRVQQGILADAGVSARLYDEAESRFAMSLTLYDRAHKNPGLGAGLVYLGRARLQAARGEIHEAEETAQFALDMFRKIEDPYAQANAHEFLGDLLKHAGDEQAADHFRQARTLYTRMDAERAAARMARELQ